MGRTDLFNIEHVFMKTLEIGWHPELVADDAGQVGAARFISAQY
jgi:hypothetical protein